MRPIDLTDTSLHLGTGPDVDVLDVDETFWATIHERTELQTGRLVMASDTSVDWDVWEMHPEGDELILVATGAVRIHVEHPDRPDLATPVLIEAPHLSLMPAGAWHTMDAMEPARVVTVTWGGGTQHRPR